MMDIKLKLYFKNTSTNYMFQEVFPIYKNTKGELQQFEFPPCCTTTGIYG